MRGYTRWLTNTTSTNFANADVDALLNDYYHQLTAKILASMDEWEFQGEIGTADLVANQREYTFPTDILKIKRVEAKLDGTNWARVETMDVQETSYPISVEADIVSKFTNTNPFYDTLDNSIYIYSGTISVATGGIKIWYEKLVTELSADTDEPVIPKPFHAMLCEGVAMQWFSKYGAQDRVREFSQKLQLKEPELINYYARRNLDRTIKMKSLMSNQDFK